MGIQAMLTPMRARMKTLQPDSDRCEDSSSRANPQQENALPASNHQLLLTGSFPDFHVDVHREQSAGAVEDGG